MVGASKILTVSYGTFSCTLEGFDDPFSTMKAIAEYFRDLAADDRYFGAEPPQPDAQMLHRIAEREIQRRVEAKIQANGVVLRQSDEIAPEPAEAPAALPAAMSAPDDARGPAVATPPQEAPMPAAAAPAVATEVIAPVAAAPMVAAEAAPVAAAPAMPVVAEVLHLDAAMAAPQDPPSPASATISPLFPADDAPGEAQAEVTEQPSAAPAAPATAPAAAAAAPAPAAPVTMDESVAAKLARIRAAVDASKAQDTALTTSGPFNADALLPADLIEDPAASGFAGGFEDGDDYLADVGDFCLEPELPAAADLVPPQAEDEAEAEADVAAATDGIAPTAPRDAEPAADEPVAETQAQAQPEEAVVDDMPVAVREASTAEVDLFSIMQRAALRPATPPDAEPGVAAGTTGSAAGAAEARRRERAQNRSQPTPPAAEVADEAASVLRRARARVIKVRRRDLEQAIAEDEARATQPAKVSIELPRKPATTLSDEDEAELAAQLAALEVEGDAPSAPTQHAQTQHAPAQHAPAERGARRTAPTDEADVSRLLESANSRLAGSETRRRFSAISHLKAAVAATVADRALRGRSAAETARPATPDKTLDRYRDDLSRVVRPQRAGAEAAPEITGELDFDAPAAPVAPAAPRISQRPAPLVLVSEQRVDLPAAQPAAQVRPRRISAEAAADPEALQDELDEDLPPASPEEARNFAEFADRLGAKGLAELLEAAAVYTATIEGRPHFSRPQIMRKISDEAEFTREAGLRSFGMLLRQGKIQKVRRGQFAISESSRFMSEARRLAS